MKLIPGFLARPFIETAKKIQVENEPYLMDTTELGFMARKEYDNAVRLELLLTLSPLSLLLRGRDILYPNPAQYI